MHCPYCLADTQPPPRRDSNCKRCGARIVVRITAEGRWLLTEAQAAAFDGESATDDDTSDSTD